MMQSPSSRANTRLCSRSVLRAICRRSTSTAPQILWSVLCFLAVFASSNAQPSDSITDPILTDFCTDPAFSLFVSDTEYEETLRTFCINDNICNSVVTQAYGNLNTNRFHTIISSLVPAETTDITTFRTLLCIPDTSLRRAFLQYATERLVHAVTAKPPCPLNHEFIEELGQTDTVTVPGLRAVGRCRCKANLICSGSHYRSGFITWVVGIVMAAIVVMLASMLWIAYSSRKSLQAALVGVNKDLVELVVVGGFVDTL